MLSQALDHEVLLLELGQVLLTLLPLIAHVLHLLLELSREGLLLWLGHDRMTLSKGRSVHVHVPELLFLLLWTVVGADRTRTCWLNNARQRLTLA